MVVRSITRSAAGGGARDLVLQSRGKIMDQKLQSHAAPPAQSINAAGARMFVAADAITLETRVHLCWRAGDAVEAALWRNAAEQAGAKAIRFYRHEDGSGYTLILEASVHAALTHLQYTPRGLAETGFQGTQSQIRRLQDLYWNIWLPRHHPSDLAFN